MSIEELIAVCPPPANPVVPDVSQWRAAEDALSSGYPADYVSLQERFGAGAFGQLRHDDDFYDLFYALSPGDDAEFSVPDTMLYLTDGLRDIRDAFPKLVSYAVFPEPTGLLYIGGTTTTHSIYWNTRGEPNEWTCVVADYGCDHWFHHEGDLTSLFARMVLGKDVPDWVIEGPTAFPLVFRDVNELSRLELA